MGLYRVVGQRQSCDLGCTYGQLLEVDAYRWSGDQDRAVDTLQQPGQLMGIEGFAGIQHHGAGLQKLDSRPSSTPGTGASNTSTGQWLLLTSKALSHSCGSKGRSE